MKCKKCGNIIDKKAHNQERAKIILHTLINDKGVTKPKIMRWNVCRNCVVDLKIFLSYEHTEIVPSDVQTAILMEYMEDYAVKEHK